MRKTLLACVAGKSCIKKGAALRATNQVKLDLKGVANGVYLIRE